MWEEYYDEIRIDHIPSFNLGNCKRCVNKSHCGNKNKKEASWCDKYRPEIKNKKGKKRK